MLSVRSARAADVILPQGREAFYASEAIELAVAGLAKQAAATIELVPQDAALSPVKVPMTGDGSTVALVIPAGTLAPGGYVVKLDGKDAAKLTVSSGVVDSTMLLSQTVGWEQLKPGGANYILGNAFSFGRFTPDGRGPLTTNLRSGRSQGLAVFDRAVAENLPTVVYMYWTGYLTHKPFGSMKSWGAADMNDAMRLLSFHTAQRLRRYSKNIVSVGTLDEPGLGWGKTPAGGTASGYPDWDETAWYERRGWKYTDDPASRPDDDWMKYMTIRCEIMKENQAQAKRDLKTIWPEVVFSTDLYAPHAVMDGTDPLAQQVNEIPASHVFVDWGIDRLGTYSGIMLEKAHDPTSKLAHAMNGQLFGEPVSQPNQLHAYRAALNGMLAAGLSSNWWLNTGGMSPADLAAVNNPVKRIGPLFREFSLARHDVAVLWSFTEIAMREKEITAKEARKKTGEQIKLMVASLPENSALKDGKELDINAYNIGGDYKETVLTAHYAVARAGYPAHIIHERLLPSGVLKNYKTLVIVGQTFALPPAVMTAIREFAAAGGKVVTDESTTAKFDGAITAATNLKGLSYRWGALFLQDPKSFKTLKEASYFQTNHFMDEPVRRAVPAFREALKQTPSAPVAHTHSDELLIERHVAGEGSLVSITSGFEELPPIGDDKRLMIYNYAPYTATYSLRSVPAGSVVYAMEGSDWSRVSKLNDPQAPITASFEPAEMKLYLVAPREPAGIELSASAMGSSIAVTANLMGLKMPWPLEVTILGPQGKILYQVYRATKADGTYEEQFPIGSNAPGQYAVTVTNRLVKRVASEAKLNLQPTPSTAKPINESVRVFDEVAIRAMLNAKPVVTIAVGNDSHRAAAEKLAGALAAAGVKVSIKPESEVLRKVHYPRVWNPYAKVFSPTGDEKPTTGLKIDLQITLGTESDGTVTAKTADGKDLNDWRQPNSLVTIAGDGFVDWIANVESCYEPGVKLYLNEQRQITVIKGQPREERSTAEFRARWAKPWTQLTTHVGGYQLPPQLPEAFTTQTDGHLILLGDSMTSQAVAAVQASDLLLQVVDAVYPGPGKSLISFVWSPFAVEKNAIVIGAADETGLQAGVTKLIELVKP